MNVSALREFVGLEAAVSIISLSGYERQRRASFLRVPTHMFPSYPFRDMNVSGFLRRLHQGFVVSIISLSGYERQRAREHFLPAQPFVSIISLSGYERQLSGNAGGLVLGEFPSYPFRDMNVSGRRVGSVVVVFMFPSYPFRDMNVSPVIVMNRSVKDLGV